MRIKILLRLITIISLFITCSLAQFKNDYSPDKWTLRKYLVPENTNDGGSNGSYTPTSSAEAASITITGSTTGAIPSSDHRTEISITAIASGTMSFHWNFTDTDDWQDYFAVYIDNVEELVNGITGVGGGTGNLSGDYSCNVTAGQKIQFVIYSTDNTSQGATVTISNFTPPGGVWIAATPPVLANLNGNTVSFTEGGASVLIDAGSDVSITDADASGYNGGNLTVSVTGAGANDDLIISTTGAVTLSAGMTNGSNVSVSGTQIGSISTNGQNGNNLVISLNANATNANIATLIQNITYTNDNNDPPASRTVNLTLTDSGSQTSTNSAITVNITGVNDKPTLTSTGSNPTYTENGAAASLYSGTSISTIEAGQTITELRLTLTNVNNGANEILSVDGSDVALTDANSVNSTTTNGMTASVSLAATTATVTIIKAGGITTAQAQTLVNGINYRNTSENPNTSNRVVTLTYIKDNGGVANGGDDDEALNIASTVTVVAVNDAPVLDNTKSPVLATIDEDLGNPTNGSTANSALVSSLIENGGLLDNYSDVEGDSPGIAVTGVNQGTLYYSTDAGANWTALGAVTANSALVLNADANTRVYFKPNSNVSGTVADAIVIKAWDRTSGANGNTGINTTAGTAFSTATDNVGITINAINDDPTMTGLPTDITATEDVASNVDLSAVTFADVDAGGSNVVLTITAGAGTLVASSGGGVTIGTSGTSEITLTGTASNIDTYLNTASNITYAGTLNTNGNDATTLTIKANDGGNTGSGGGNDVALGTVNVDITAVNDAPVLDNTKSPVLATIDEDLGNPSNGSTANSVLVSSLIENGGLLDNYSDVEGDSPGIAVTGVNQGTLYYSTDAGTNWTALGAVTANSALVLNADANTRVYFKPNSNVSGTVADAIVIKAWDRTSGANGNTGINTTAGTAFSTATDNVAITINEINDKPTLTATASDPTYTENGAAASLYSGTSISTIESGQTITELRLTLTNVNNGANEILSVDGSDVALTDANSVNSTTTNGMTASVSLAATTATVTITKAGGITTAQAQTLVNGITYRNTSENPNTSNRVTTLTYIKDNGGTANGGDDDEVLGVASTVTIVAVNDAPTLTNLNNDNPTIALTASGNIDYGENVVLADVDSPDFNGGSLLIHQTTGTTNGNFLVDGVNVLAGGNTAIAVNENITVGGTTIGTVDATKDGQNGADLLINFNADASIANIQLLLRNIKYSPPSATGDRDFTLTLNDGDGIANGGVATTTAAIKITVNALPSEINIKQGTDNIADGGSYGYGNKLVNSDNDITFTIENTGTGSLTLTTPITLGGANADQFSIQAQPASPVAASGTTTYVVRFSPTSVGAKTATLAIANNDSDENPYNITLTGTGISPEISVEGNTVEIADGDPTPDVIDHTEFGNADILIGSVVRTFTIKNVGTSTLNLSGTPIVAVSGVNADQFSVTTQPSAATIVASSSLTFQVTFDPTTIGLKTAVISIANDDLNENPYNFSIQGTGISAPEIKVEGNNLEIINNYVTPSTVDNTDFSSVTIGGGSKTNKFVIKNIGSAVLTGVTASLEGADVTNFEITDGHGGAIGNISPGNEAELNIKFTPSSLGEKNAKIRIISNDADENPTLFNIMGTGVGEANLVVSCDGVINTGDTILISNQALNEMIEKEITVINNGNTDMQINLPLQIEGADADYFEIISQPSINVLPNSSTSFKVKFQSDVEGIFNSHIKLNTTAANIGTFTINLSAKAIDKKPRILNLEQLPLRFIEKGNPLVISDSLRILDSDSKNLVGATIKIENSVSEDSLFVVDNNNLKIVYTNTRNAIELAGVDNISEYETLLKRIRYKNTNLENPDNRIRSLSIVLRDSLYTSKAYVRALEVEDLNDKPVFKGIEEIVFDEDDTYQLFKNKIESNIYDVDDASTNLTYKLEPENLLIKLETYEDYYLIKPEQNVNGEHNLKLTISDTKDSSVYKIKLIINAVNDEFDYSNLPDTIKVHKDSLSAINLFDFINDPDTPDSLLVFSFTASTDSVKIEYDNETGELNVKALFPEYYGKVTITIEIIRSGNRKVTLSFILDIFKNLTDIKEEENIPLKYYINQNYPNPFNPSTTIEFELPEEGKVNLVVYNVLGQVVSELVNKEYPAGRHKLTFNANNLPSGIYIYRIITEKYRETKKMLLVK